MFSVKAVSRGREKPILTPLTYLKCLSCETINSRPFKEGDYVFEEIEEKCPKCGGTKMKIIGIYVKEPPKEKRKIGRL